jgi:hypothetical protein
MVIGIEEEEVISADIKMFLEGEKGEDHSFSVLEDALDVLEEQLYELLPKSLRMLVAEEKLHLLVRDYARLALARNFSVVNRE